MLVVLFIRLSISKTADAIKEVSDAAEKLANGTFGNQLLVRSEDEVGELTCNFNKMTQQTLLLKQAILLFKRCF